MKAMAFDPGEFAITLTRKACGASMASICHSRSLAVEVMPALGRYAETWRRQTFEEMTAGEQPAQNWEST